MRLVLGDAERIESRLATRFRCSIVPYALPVLPRLDQQLAGPALSPAACDDRQALLVAAELRATRPDLRDLSASGQLARAADGCHPLELLGRDLRESLPAMRLVLGDAEV